LSSLRTLVAVTNDYDLHRTSYKGKNMPKNMRSLLDNM
jgi:hypothetical protein